MTSEKEDVVQSKPSPDLSRIITMEFENLETYNSQLEEIDKKISELDIPDFLKTCEAIKK